MYVLEQSGRKAYDGGDSLLSLALAVSHVTFAPVVRGCVVVFVLRDASGEVIISRDLSRVCSVRIRTY